jgi:hypothetical protein
MDDTSIFSQINMLVMISVAIYAVRNNGESAPGVTIGVEECSSLE